MTITTPRIINAARQNTVHAAALEYAAMGISLLACKTDKSPALRNWKHLQARRAMPDTINLWARTGLLQSVGIICGEVSRNLVVVDCDGLDAVKEFSRAFPALTDTYTVISGSGKGAHFYLYSDECPPTTRTVGQPFGNIEMRSNGAYVIAPPSLHPSGQKYSVDKPYAIRTVPNLHALRAWIEGLIKAKHGGVMPPPAGTVFNPAPYAASALKSECDKVLFAPIGTRNDTINLAAFKMGRFVKSGQLHRSTVETAILQAAASWLGNENDTWVRKTIKSGLDAGILKAGS